MKLDYAEVKKTADTLKFRTQAFIDGKFVAAQSGRTLTTENPPPASRSRKLLRATSLMWIAR